jgi:hypothetical protein
MSDDEAKAVPATNAAAPAGPLVVSETNPRYFTLAASERLGTLYLFPL